MQGLPTARMRQATITGVRRGLSTARWVLPEDHGEAVIQTPQQVGKATPTALGTPRKGQPTTQPIVKRLQGAGKDRITTYQLLPTPTTQDPKERRIPTMPRRSALIL